MLKLLESIGRFQSLRGRLLGLPVWARGILFLVALPGVILLGLSIAAVLVSFCLLSLLTVPTYRFLRAIAGGSEAPAGPVGMSPDFMSGVFSPEPASPGRRHVDVKIIEQPE